MRRTEVEELLEQNGLRPKKAFGQNFCCDPNLVDAFVRDAGVLDSELVLEVGVGTGALTRGLTKIARRVIGVEIDSGLYELSQRLLAEDISSGKLKILHCDALNTKNELNLELLALLREELASDAYSGLRVVANLPYSVATPLVLLLLEARLRLSGIYVLVQREAALRFLSPAGGEDYGAVSVLVQLWARGKILRTVPRDVFHPRPKVVSCYLELVPHSDAPAAESYPLLRAIVRGLFNSRRKTLRRAAALAIKADASLDGLVEALDRCGFDAQGRVECLAPTAFQSLTEELLRPSKQSVSGNARHQEAADGGESEDGDCGDGA